MKREKHSPPVLVVFLRKKHGRAQPWWKWAPVRLGSAIVSISFMSAGDKAKDKGRKTKQNTAVERKESMIRQK